MKMKTGLSRIAREFAGDESGATAIEYGLIGGIVGVGLVASLQSLETGLSASFTNTATAVAP